MSISIFNDDNYWSNTVSDNDGKLELPFPNNIVFNKLALDTDLKEGKHVVITLRKGYRNVSQLSKAFIRKFNRKTKHGAISIGTITIKWGYSTRRSYIFKKFFARFRTENNDTH